MKNIMCAACGKSHDFDFRNNVKWEIGHPENAIYSCPHCGFSIETMQSRACELAIKWVAAKDNLDAVRIFVEEDLCEKWMEADEPPDAKIYGQQQGATA